MGPMRMRLILWMLHELSFRIEHSVLLCQVNAIAHFQMIISVVARPFIIVIRILFTLLFRIT